MNLIESLNLKLVNLTSSGFEASMTLSDFHAQPQGYLNGGATLASAEILAGMASNQITDDQHFAVGQAISGNHLRPTKAEGSLKIIGELLLSGKTSHVWEIRFMKEEKLISVVRVTNALVEI
ncbi:PaaI family thioesterase [Lactococcus termiticola]|uniref:Thioesterase domain-containing protein n=1 Tax=Lactococcus termiticola TaxID=2169526 RepID=A0A2R5HEG2_9LACT|nr:PaaI family thioesterase [Lactococcus termiticola]GBG96429.1 hypothetical protein NtB2_00541 [Lactococcus termiticola]